MIYVDTTEEVQFSKEDLLQFGNLTVMTMYGLLLQSQRAKDPRSFINSSCSYAQMYISYSSMPLPSPLTVTLLFLTIKIAQSTAISEQQIASQGALLLYSSLSGW